ncbi:MAG: YbaB/EbfC family nucleoid-associated protein [Veillonella sp.]|nr:YbaB/EbfC family nucleoid-associated protein [Veillonella sp.]
MMNMQNMMKQAQKLQKQMEKSQAELAATTFTGKSAQDLVVAELTGDKKLESEGAVEKTTAKVKDVVEDVKDAVEGALDGLKNSVDNDKE